MAGPERPEVELVEALEADGPESGPQAEPQEEAGAASGESAEEETFVPPSASAFSGTATIGRVPGPTKRVKLSAKPNTISDLFSAHGISVQSARIQLNGKEAKLTDLVRDGDTVLAVVRIRGN